MKKQFILSIGLVCLAFFGNCNNLPDGQYASCNRKCEEKKDICYIAMYGSTAPTINYLACEAYKISCENSCGSSSKGGSKSSSGKSSSGGSRTSSSSGSKSSSSGSSSSGGGSSSGGSGGSSHQILTDLDD